MSLIRFNKYLFNTLEIKTSDGELIYVPREWLESLSPYFNSLLSNGCKESYSNSCYLDYDKKILSIIFDCIYNSHHRDEYIRKIYFSKLSSSEDYYNLISAFSEYQLDDLLIVFDEYLSELNPEEYISSILIDLIFKCNMNDTKDKIKDFLIENKCMLKFIDYSKVSFEFTELFYDFGVLYHLKIFTLWANFHKPTDTQLIGSSLLNHVFKFDKNIDKSKLNNIMSNLSNGLENAKSFKCKLYEKILYGILNSYAVNKEQMKVSTDYKKFIKKEMTLQKTNNRNIDNFELIFQTIKKWREFCETEETEDEY